MTTREWVIFAPLALLTILFGVWPAPLFDILEPAAQMLARALNLI
jgi:NADH-quinone oxidoreductase subunit M